MAVYHEFEKFQKGSITRREFLSRAVALGAGTSAMMASLQGCAPAATSSGSTISPTAASGAAKTLSKPADGVDKSYSPVFRGWAYSVDTVEDNTKKFNAAYSENVNYKTITGDYISIIENMHINKQPLDMAYSNPATMNRWRVPGWIHDMEGFWDVDKAKQEMYPGVLESLTIDGKLCGLPYFVSNRGCVHTNDVLLEKVGITPAEYPKTYEEMYDQARRIQKDGAAESPLLSHWFSSGIWFGVSWGYLFECINRGAVLFDDKNDNEPVFDEKSLSILNEWKKMYEEKLVPEGIFTMGETDFIDAFCTGKFAYSQQQTYDNKVFNDPAKSVIAGKSRLVPAQGQSWGLIDEGVYVLPNRGQDDANLGRAYRLNGFFGYRDHNEDLFVAKRWAIENGLNSGYKAVLEDPDVIAAYKVWSPDEKHIETMNGLLAVAPFPKVWQAFWWEEFNTLLSREVQSAVLGQKPVKEAHEGLKKAAQGLKAQYAS